MTVKIAVNTEYGGFSISYKCAELILKNYPNMLPYLEEQLEDAKRLDLRGVGLNNKCFNWPETFCDDYYRTDPRLIWAIEQLGEDANGHVANIELFEMPHDVYATRKFYITDYDGSETVHEHHWTNWSKEKK